MNLDDLMEVWRSQDASPLHGVNDTLLRVALRQDEAKLQAHRRVERRIIYVMSAVFVAVMLAFCLFIAISDKLTGWNERPFIDAAIWAALAGMIFLSPLSVRAAPGCSAAP